MFFFFISRLIFFFSDYHTSKYLIKMAILPPGKDIRLHHLLNYRYIILNILYILKYCIIVNVFYINLLINITYNKSF